MSKKLMILVLILVFARGRSQSDSTAAIKFSGFQLDFHTLLTFNDNNSLSREQVRKFAPNDQLLHADLTNCDSSAGAYFIDRTSRGGGFRVFVSLSKIKKFRVDIFGGIYLNNGKTMRASYSHAIYDTVNVYTSANGNLYDIDVFSDNYNFTLINKQVLMSMGITINTNKQKRVWVSTGLSISPGIMTNYILTSSNDVPYYRYTVTQNYPQEDYWKLQPTSGISISNSVGINHTFLKMTGFTCYVYIPSSVNLRVSKKIKFFEYMNLSVGLSPGYYYARDKIHGTRQSFAWITDLGLRFNF